MLKLKSERQVDENMNEMFTFQWIDKGDCSKLKINMKPRLINDMVRYLALNSNIRLMLVCKEGGKNIPSKKVRHLVEGLFVNSFLCVALLIVISGRQS